MARHPFSHLSYWSTFFLLGGFVGLFVMHTKVNYALLAVGLSFFLLLAWVCLTISWSKITVSLLAFGWGFWHHAPSPPTSACSIAVTRTTLGQGPSLIFELDGKDYLAFGNSESGNIGGVKTGHRKDILGRIRAKFVETNRSYHPYLLVEHLAISLHQLIRNQIYQNPISIQGWLACFFLGDSTLAKELLFESFRQTGLIHLLAISGLHISLLSYFFFLFSLGLAQILYAFNLMLPATFQLLKVICSLFSILIGFVFVLAIHSPFSATRAIMIASIHILRTCFFSTLTTKESVLLAFSAQSLIFPLAMIHESTLLSWGSYLLLVGAKGNLAALTTTIKVQLKLFVFVCAVLGQYYLLSPISNLLILSVLPFIVFCSLCSLCINLIPKPIFQIAVWVQESFLECIYKMAEGFALVPYANDDPLFSGYLPRIIAIFASVYFLLNSLKRIAEEPTRA